MKTQGSSVALAFASLVIVGCWSDRTVPPTATAIPPAAGAPAGTAVGTRAAAVQGAQAAASAAEVLPLKEGQSAPTQTLRRPDGEAVDLAKVYAAKPSILIFYRGGWCPYCNTHLMDMVQAEPKLVAMGYQVLAVSPDSPAALKTNIDKNQFSYQILSDSDMALAKGFGLAFKVDDATLAKLGSYNIDLERASGKDHHLLPVPAVYIVDTQGIIRFAHSDPDYTKRMPTDQLLETARRVAAK